MKNNILKYFILFLSVLVILTVYLSTICIETDKFNDQIKKRISLINKETCMNMLKARLYDYELKKIEEESQNVESSKSEIGWGHQIRSYVLHPYRLVKDNRTNFESTSPYKVLDGDIDEFLEQSLYKLNEK